MSTLRSNKHSVIYQSTLYRPVLCTTDEGQAWPPTHAHGADETAMGKDKKDVDNSNTSGRAESNSIPLRNGHINGQLTNNSNVSHDPSFTDGKLLPNGRILTLNHQPLQDKPTEPVSTCRKAAETVNTKSPLRGTQNTDTSPKTNGTTRHPPSIPQKETSSHMGKMNGSKRRYSRLLLKRQQEDNSLSTVKTGEAEVDELMYETNHIRNRKADNRPLTVGVKQGRASSVETEERSGTWKPNVDKCDSGEQGVEKTTKGQTGSRNGSNASETETKAIFKAVPVEKHSSSDENRPRDPDTSHIFISKEVVASCRENDHGKPVADKGASCRENDHGKPAANNGAIKASHHHTNTKPDVPWGSNNTEASSVLVPDEQPTTVTTGGHNTDNRTQEINLSDRNHARSLPLTRKGGKTARKNLIKSRDKVENFDDSTVPTTVDNDHVATDDAAKSDSTDRELHDSERSQKGLSSVSKPHRNTIQSDTEDGSCINNNTFRDETLINRSITIKSPSTVPTNHPATYRAGTGNSVHQELVSEISTQSTDAKPDRNVNFKQTSHVDRDLITMPGGHSSVSSINEPSTSREGELPKKNGVVKNSRSTQRVRFSPSTGPRTSEDTSPPGGAVLQVGFREVL
ncbi:hypothetical protein BaRGS_00029926 [Batillaria attramentaria]|uniref:Uncharacterized protein n=1 Tax=Batillaria attramentaria TaxID=370345 RepID=A0ABD0JV62_9CAEN